MYQIVFYHERIIPYFFLLYLKITLEVKQNHLKESNEATETKITLRMCVWRMAGQPRAMMVFILECGKQNAPA